MKSTRRGSGVWLACALALAAAPALAQSSHRCPNGDDDVARIDVTVDHAAGAVYASPMSATIELNAASAGPHRVCWVVSGLEAGEELRFEDKNPDDAGYFPNLARTVKDPPAFANSGNPSRAGTWSYTLRVVAGGQDVAVLDPDVVIKP